MRILAILLLGCLSLLTSSCAGRGKKAVVGKWQSTAGSIIEFRPDGTATMTSTHSRQVQYTMPDPQKIAFCVTVNGNLARWQWTILSLTSQELVVSHEQGKKTVMRRVQ